MTFGQFAKGVFYLPAAAVSGISAILLGATYRNQDGEKENFRGIFGAAVDAVRFVGNFILDAAKFLARGITNFIANHDKAIAVAFWSSLALAGAAALTVAYWPAALAAVTGFTVGGVSLAALVGTGYLAQVGAVAGAAAVATSAAVYVAAAVINTFNAIGALFFSRKKGNEPYFEKLTTDEPEYLGGQSGHNPMVGLNSKPNPGLTKRSGTSSESEEQPPVHFRSPISSDKAPVTQEPVLETTDSATAGISTTF